MNNLYLMKKRIIDSDIKNFYYNLNDTTSLQQQRMIIDKKKSLMNAINYSYQGAIVKNLITNKTYKALINPNKLKQDYDDKIISIPLEAEFSTGTLFEWKITNTIWLIYLQDLTELAYFKGDVRRCKYKIEWLNENNKVCSTYAAVRGPVETKINFIQKNSISIDEPNYSLNILMPKNEETLKYFQRYSKFYLQDIINDKLNTKICWRIEAIDSISMDNIIEVNAVEYYANKDEDDIEKGLAGSLIIQDLDTSSTLEGETIIKPYITYTYKYTGTSTPIWKVDTNLPIIINIIDKNTITLKWDSSYSGNFDLYFTENEKQSIIVESIF